MKKTLKTLLALLLSTICLLGCVSCAKKPKLDLQDAEKNLKGEDYVVGINDDEDVLGVGIKETLTAYNDDELLVITVYDNATMAKHAYKELEFEFEKERESIKLEISKKKFILKKYEKDLDSDEIDKYEDDIKDLEKELEEMKDNLFGISGKTVWYGTSRAIEDSRG